MVQLIKNSILGEIMRDYYRGVILVLFSTLCFSFLPIFAIFAYEGGINVTTLLFIRFISASVLLFIYSFIKYKSISVNKKTLLFLFILGAIGYNLQSRFYFTSLLYITPSLAALLLYTYPVLVSILSFFIDKERLSKKVLMSAGISFVGIVMILGTSIGAINIIGIMFAFGASLVYSLYILMSNRVIKKTPPPITSAYITLFASFGTLIFGMITNTFNFNFEPTTWIPIIGIVAFPTLCAMIFFFQGMYLLGPTKTSIISLMEVVFVLFFSSVLLNDHLTVYQLIGGVAVLFGAYMVIKAKNT